MDDGALFLPLHVVSNCYTNWCNFYKLLLTTQLESGDWSKRTLPFYRMFKKRLAQSVRCVGESNIDAQTLLYVAICNEFVRYRAQMKQRNILFLGRQRRPYIVFRNRFLYGFMFVYQTAQ